MAAPGSPSAISTSAPSGARRSATARDPGPLTISGVFAPWVGTGPRMATSAKSASPGQLSQFLHDVRGGGGEVRVAAACREDRQAFLGDAARGGRSGQDQDDVRSGAGFAPRLRPG